MTKPKLIASHYTIAQVTRLTGVEYNRIRSAMARVPGCQTTIAGTKMIAAEFVPKIRAAAQAIKKERGE